MPGWVWALVGVIVGAGAVIGYVYYQLHDMFRRL